MTLLDDLVYTRSQLRQRGDPPFHPDQLDDPDRECSEIGSERARLEKAAEFRNEGQVRREVSLRFAAPRLGSRGMTITSRRSESATATHLISTSYRDRGRRMVCD